MMKVRWRLILLVIGLLLVACGSGDEAPADQPAQETAAEPTQEQVLEADILPAPSNTPPPAAEPTEDMADGAETPVGQEAEATPTEPLPTEETLPTATAAPQFNGEFEDTFYRGLATAPITMIDYSDFL